MIGKKQQVIGRKAERKKEFEELTEKYDRLYSEYQESSDGDTFLSE